MKFLLDVHISYKIANALKEIGHEAIHINTILDKWYTKDSAICKYADENELILVTKDADFRKQYFLSGTPKKLIKINLGNIPTSKLISIIQKNISQISSFFSSANGYIEIGVDKLTLYR
jgi:predicted nuclease of predicted toxin-antitoxin system